MIIDEEVSIKNIYYYLQGWFRYYFYYSRFKFLIRKHIREQITYRINSIDKECYNNGSCKMCGCQVTALQMANKQCDKPCYPKMLSKKEWNIAKINFYYNDWLINNNQKTFEICVGNSKINKLIVKKEKQ